MTQDSDNLLQKMAIKQAEIANDVKHMVKWSESHDVEDQTRFKAANDKIDAVTRLVYMGVGGLVVVQLVINFIK